MDKLGKERQREADKRYYLKNIEKKRAYSREYQRKHKKEKAKYDRDHKKERKEYRKKYLQEHPEYARKHKESAGKFHNNNLDSWRSFFSNLKACEICGRSIIFASGNKRDSIHFDHRHDGIERIKTSPAIWLSNCARSPENEEIWKSCDFGVLCQKCNSWLPTKGRTEWLVRVIKYNEKEKKI